MKKTQRGQPYLSTIAAAELLEVSESYVRRLLRRGDLSGCKIGERAWLVEKTSVEKHRKTRAKTAG
jgi:excisionase family DNA binding protein